MAKLIKIQVGYVSYLLLTPEEAAPVLEIISKANLYSAVYEDGKYKYKKNDDTVEIGFVDDLSIQKTLADHAEIALKTTGNLL